MVGFWLLSVLKDFFFSQRGNICIKRRVSVVNIELAGMERSFCKKGQSRSDLPSLVQRPGHWLETLPNLPVCCVLDSLISVTPEVAANTPKSVLLPFCVPSELLID